MTREPFPAFAGFIETGFEQRFQGLLRQARQQRSWHVIVAEPGSGKTMGIRDLVETTARGRGTMGGQNFPILAVTAPKNDPKEQALGKYLQLAMDVQVRGRWSELKYNTMYLLRQYGVECVVIDDAHDLSLQHLILLKELTDQLRLPPYDHALGLCLVTAGRGATMPLKDVLDRPETMWMQFRRRLDAVQPYCKIAGHTLEEVRAILLALERIYQAVFPASQSAQVDRSDLYLVDPSATRSRQQWTSDDGSCDEVGQCRAPKDLCRRGNGRERQYVGSRSRAAHPAA